MVKTRYSVGRKDGKVLAFFACIAFRNGKITDSVFVTHLKAKSEFKVHNAYDIVRRSQFIHYQVIILSGNVRRQMRGSKPTLYCVEEPTATAGYIP